MAHAGIPDDDQAPAGDERNARGDECLALECPLQAQVIADVNGSSDVNIADPVYLLGYLFLGGPPPPPPSGACGALDGADAAWCTRMECAR